MLTQAGAFSPRAEKRPARTSASIMWSGASAVVLDPDAAERDKAANTPSIVAYLTP